MKALTQSQMDAAQPGSRAVVGDTSIFVAHYFALVKVGASTYAVFLDSTGPGLEVAMSPFRVQGNQVWFAAPGSLTLDLSYAFRNRIIEGTETEELVTRIANALREHGLLGDHNELFWELISAPTWYCRDNHVSLLARRQSQAVQKEAVRRQKRQPPNVVPEGVFIRHNVIPYHGGTTVAYRILQKKEGGEVIQFGTSLFLDLGDGSPFQRKIGTRFALKALEERGEAPFQITKENYKKTPAGQIEMHPDQPVLDQITCAIGVQLTKNHIFNMASKMSFCAATDTWILLPRMES